MLFLSQKSRKRSAVALIAIFCFVTVGTLNLLRPVTAYAFPVEDISQAVRNVTDNIGSSLLSAGLGAVVNGASYFMRKIAYDTAKYVASGASGQKPLAFQEGFGKYLANTALDSAGSAIEQLGEPFGLNLCKPPDIRLQIGLQVSISKIYENEFGGADGEGGPQPRCTWNDFTENWKNSPETMFNDQALLEKFNVSLKTSQGDLGAALSIFGKVDNIIAKKQLANQLDRLEGDGFKSVTDIISGDIRTPAQVIKKETDTITGGKQAELSAQQIAGIYGAGAVQILPMALSVFANTLVNSLLQNVLEKGLLPSKGSGGSSVTNFYASTLNSNRQVADAAFSYLIAGIPQRPLTTYDVVTEYSTCSTNPGLNNCVMDNGLTQAVNRARTEAPLTIGEALKQGLLHANWQLIPPDRETDNTNLQYCYSSAYCISNVQKLRKARILPLGFEIATMKSDPDHPWTLGEVIGDGRTTGFYDCDSTGKPSAAHPFCKLIDPNWIIKAPEARCEVRVNGPELLTPTAATRREECVDFSTCLATDSQGQCVGFGYCTKEENTWKMPGASCDAQFNTCKTYKATNGAIASYLSRTIDIASCNVNSVGCLAYSTDKSGDQWKQTLQADAALTFEGRTQAIHLNARASSLQCPSSAEGCSLFVDPTTSANEKLYLKKAPDYLGCYDVNPETNGTIEWPQTEAELTKLTGQKTAACSQFASACIPEEVGCQGYKPKDGGISVTGVIGGNRCPVQCVGYETFKQEGTTFEPGKFPLHFIASNAGTCSVQQVGCDEFTNIGAANAGGESLEYYSNLKHCEIPNGQNGKVFYSWEGSESQGYVLKRHTLLQMTNADASYVASLNLGSEVNAELVEGSPAYVDDTKTALQTNYNQCNQTSYNLLLNNPYDPKAASADCRAFYDSAGGIYYRILRSTVTVSAACTPLRKTNSELFRDDNIVSATICQEKGGLWENENNQCKRCYNGGRYDVNDQGFGSCVYQSIRSEATSCPVTANGCRSYIGNTGNNIYEAALFGFEPTDNSIDALNEAKKGWSGNISVEAESLQVGLHSLRVNGADTAHTFESGKIQAGAWYELRFWARGNTAFGLSSGFSQNGQQIGNPFTFDQLTNSNVLAPLSTEWREYHLGPVQFTGDANGQIQLFFAGQALGGGQISVNQFYFIDNVSLVQIGGQAGDHLFLIKNSWRTPEGYEAPLACDSTPDNGLPGEYLGCRAWTQTDTGETATLTSFDRLCRAEAVGCRAVVDTQNTFDGVRPEERQAYGVICRKSDAVTQATSCTVVLNESVEVNSSYSCTVEKGKKECRIKSPVILGSSLTLVPTTECISDGDSCNGTQDKLFIDQSTLVIRADSDAIYLASQKQFQCPEQQLGCMKVALEQQTVANNAASSYVYQETFIKNDPRKYNDVLCSGEEVGCAEFKQNNSVAYFKDPKLTGNSLCVYKQNVTKENKTYSGWFMDGVGTCGAGTEVNKICKTDSECGGGGAKCENIGTTACYNNYTPSENSYGLWSQGSPGYKGFVGVCDSGSNGCTELIDRATVSADNPKGTSYYVLMNERLTQNQSQCEGKVSQKEGCVLFDMTENPDKKYNTLASYKASENTEPRNISVLPDESSPQDANIILKVERDRQCKEWLACRKTSTIFDEEGRPRTLCNLYAACDEFGPDGTCTASGWVDTTGDSTRMTEEKYIKRPTGWNSPEYSGYTLYGAYNPSNYVYLLFPSTSDDVSDTVAYLGYEMSGALFAPSSGYEAKGCREIDAQNRYVKRNGDKCGFDDGGRCYAQRCLYPINGVFTFAQSTNVDKETASEQNVESMTAQLQPGICKSYPEENSPFPIKIAVDDSYIKANKQIDIGGKNRVEISEKKQKYEQANVCQFGEKNLDGTPKKDCSCEYIKTEYKNGTTDYWPLGSDVPSGVCSGDSATEGRSCEVDSECGTNGKCNLVQKKGTSYGLKGLCLEYDFSRPIAPKNDAKLFESFQCLTWLPIQVSASAIDIDGLSENAGYNPNIDAGPGGEAYCTESTARGAGYYDTSLDSTVVGSIGEFGGTIGRTNPPLNPGSLPPPTENESAFPKFNELILYSKSDNKVTYSYNDNVIPEYDQIPVFDSEKLTNYGKEGGLRVYKNHDGQGSNEYSTLLKSSGYSVEDKARMMRTMQAFGWKNIGTSARVLRIDTRGKEGCADNIGYGHNQETCEADEHLHRIFYDQKSQSDSSKIVYAFAPLTNFSGSGSDDTGVLMHPPRLFNNNTIDPEEYFMDPGPGYYADKVGTAAFSPEFKAAGDNKFMYNDYAVESNLNIADLKSVHFVPISFPDGSEGYNPALLTTDVNIDFVALHQSQNRTEGGAAKVAAYSNGEDPQYYIDIKDSNEKMNRVAYLLERNENSSLGCNGLLSYCDYNPATMGASGPRLTAFQGLNSIDKARTEIHYRYVTLIFSGASGEPFASLVTGSSVQAPNNATTDPFQAACTRTTGRRNWLAIGMDFNKDGEFLGYISRWCMNTENSRAEANGIRFATIANLQDRCLEFSAVVDNSNPFGSTNKAWTDRVWSGRTFGPVVFFDKIRNQSIPPFGSLYGQTSETISENPNKNTPMFGFPDFNWGIPYQCYGGDGFGTPILGKKMFLDYLRCTAPTSESSEVARIISSNYDAGAKELHKLFMKYYKIKTIEDPTSPRLIDSGEDVSNNPAAVDSTITTQAPHVFALNLSTCADQSDVTCTAAGVDAFTVNSRNYTVDEDKDGQPGVDPIIGEGGAYEATIQFFAYADDNRMPINRVTVNWGDGIIDPKVALYQNHKPYCAAGNDTASVGDMGRCTGSQLTCKDDADCAGAVCNKQATNPIKFGDTQRACTEHYFEFSYVYSCPSSDPSNYRLVSSLQGDPEIYSELIRRGISPSSRVCVFQPGVQILDNWGWCNASDANRNPVSSGMYNDTNGLCDENPNAYTFYKGKIIVIP